MRADNSRHVIAAAHRRAEQTRRRAVTALRRMDATGQRITFDAVAARPGSPGPGFTPSRTCAPRSSGSASGTRPLRRRRFLHNGSTHRIPRCYAASRRPPPASVARKQSG
jgi:hypothetical protein